MNDLATIRPAMRGQVTAIIPQSIEEVFRVSKGVVQSGLAPDALVKGKNADEAASSVAVVIMSGAELGLKPMVALRSFTVINGKPALFGDGLINVVRQSGKATYLRTGHVERDGKLVGFCEAKRNDTGEESRVEFSQVDAVRAGLWQTSGQSPWAKYPQRMLAWRAAGWCLRELFGDVLGGMRDEFETQEMVEPERTAIAPPPPPDDATEDAIDVEPEKPAFDAAGFLANLFAALSAPDVDSEERLEEVWDEWDVEATLSGQEQPMTEAFTIKKDRLEALSFPGDR